MILPQPYADRRSAWRFGLAGALLLLGGIYLFLQYADVPVLRSSRSLIRQLDPVLLASYAPPEVPPDEVEADPEVVLEEETPPPSSEAPAAAEVEQALDALMRRYEEAPTATAPRTEARPSARAEAEDGVALSADGGLGDLLGAAPDVLPRGVATRRPAVRNAPVTPGVALQQPAGGSAQGDGLADVLAVDAAGVASTDRSRTAEVLPEIAVENHTPETYEGLSVDGLAAWMQAHPADLPAGVKRHLGHQPSALTSVVSFRAGDDVVELYLMYKESLRELHIVLVQGEASTYLIDRGFREQSLSLREGIVTRADGVITAVDSQAGDASGPRAQAFYSIFLSWWAQATDR